jgi:choice-of-anchor C domain-containing protein
MKTVLAACGGIALLTAFAAPQETHAAMLLNGDLETTLGTDSWNMVSATTTHNNNALLGWTITSGAIDVIPDSYWRASTGNYSVDLAGSPGIGGISQTVTTVIGEEYQLLFDFAVNPQNNTGEGESIKRLAVRAIANDGDVDGIQVFSDSKGTRKFWDMQWETEVFLFTATSTRTTIAFNAMMPLNLSAAFTPINVFGGPVIDNVVLDLAPGTPTQFSVPEPASLAVLALGSMAMLRRRR